MNDASAGFHLAGFLWSVKTLSSDNKQPSSFFRTYSASIDFNAVYMCNRKSKASWLFLNDLSVTIAVECNRKTSEMVKMRTLCISKRVVSLIAFGKTP